MDTRLKSPRDAQAVTMQSGTARADAAQFCGPASAPAKGRGSAINPGSRFDRLVLGAAGLPDGLSDWPGDPEDALPRAVPTEVLVDHSRDVIARNESPDLGFDFSLNPYRGCEHGCTYCYARPYHEYLGLSAGLDFETKIFAKPQAPQLLEQRLRAPSWQPALVLLSGATDCYQPAERKLGITRGCLEVFLKFRHPVAVITKNALILRDLDLLAELAQRRLVAVTISITTLDAALARSMEPRASAPGARLEALERLARAGVPTAVNVAPIIPGLTDHELPALLAEAAARGARSARYILVRLPHGVKEIFLTWLRQQRPLQADKVQHAIQSVRGGALSDPRFGSRMRGEGHRAELIARLFALHCERLGLTRPDRDLDTSQFRVPTAQTSLLDELAQE